MTWTKTETGEKTPTSSTELLPTKPQLTIPTASGNRLKTEKLVEKFQIKRECKFENQGCQFQVLEKDWQSWQSHRLQCHFRGVSCDQKQGSTQCKGTICDYANYFHHIRNHHAVEGLKGTILEVAQFVNDEHSGLQIDITQDLWPMHYMEAFDEIFLTGTEVVFGKIFWWISVMTKEEDAAKYVAKISLKLKSEGLETSWTGPVHCFRKSSEAIREQGRCLVLNRETLQPYICMEITQSNSYGGKFLKQDQQCKVGWNVTFSVSEKDESSTLASEFQGPRMEVVSSETLDKLLAPFNYFSSWPTEVKQEEEVLLNNLKMRPCLYFFNSWDGELDIKETRSILNKLTAANFERLVEQFLELLPLENNKVWICAVVKLLFQRALDEPWFSKEYMRFVCTLCCFSKVEPPKLNPNLDKAIWQTFRKFTLDLCQQNFLKLQKSEEQIKELELGQSRVTFEVEAIKSQVRRESLLNASFVGELFTFQLLTPKIVVECAQMLLGKTSTQFISTEIPPETSLESLAKLLTIVGKNLDAQLREIKEKIEMIRAKPEAKQTLPKWIPEDNWMTNIITQLRSLSENTKFSSRVRLALLDVVELRENNWEPQKDEKNSSTKKGNGKSKTPRKKGNLPSEKTAKKGRLKGKEIDWSTLRSTKSTSQVNLDLKTL